MAETHPVQRSKVVAVDFRAKASPSTAEAPESDAPTDPVSWRAACQRMKGLHPAHYHNWIGLLRFGGDDGACITLYANNQFVAHYVQTHLIGIIMEAVEATLGPRRRIVVRVSE